MTLAALIGVALTLSLGRWQLSRAAQKEALQAAIETQGKLPPLTNAELVASPQASSNQGAVQGAENSSQIHRRIKLIGTWVPANTVFLDNRQMDAKPGFYVVTPLRLQDSLRVVLVQRGWVQRDFQDRSRLPAIETPPSTVEIEGRVAPPPPKLVDLGPDGLGQIRQNLDMTAFATETGLALLPMSVVQTNAPPSAPLGSPPLKDGLLRNWPVPASGASKNYGYAVQWFALSLLVAVLYGWFGLGKPMLNKVKRHG